MQNPCSVHPAFVHLFDLLLLAKQALRYLKVMWLPCMALSWCARRSKTDLRGLSIPLSMQSGRREIGLAEVQDGLNLQALEMVCSRVLAHCWRGSCAQEFLCSPSSMPPAAMVAALAICLHDAAQLAACFTPALQEREDSRKCQGQSLFHMTHGGDASRD